MNKQEKRKRYILNLFKDYSDEELLKMFEKKFQEFASFVITTVYVKEILKNYNRYYLLDKSMFIDSYYKLSECVQYRNLENMVHYADVHVSLDNIKKQLKENMMEERLRLIIEEIYLEDYYSGTNLKLMEVFNQYGKIFKDLKEGYLLIGTLNLLNVPGFVFPIFKKDNKYYFQNAENGQVINSFEEITREEIIKLIKVLKKSKFHLKNIKMVYNVGDAPIAAYLYDDKLFISDTTSMIEYLDSLDIKNEIFLHEIEVFKDDVKGKSKKLI